jgi:hypothetical protein
MALPSLVVADSTNAVEMLRCSSDGNLQHARRAPARTRFALPLEVIIFLGIDNGGVEFASCLGVQIDFQVAV